METITLEMETTMYIHVNGRNIEITDAIKAYVKEKAGKVAAHYEQINSIEAVLSVIKNPSVNDSHIAEINRRRHYPRRRKSRINVCFN